MRTLIRFVAVSVAEGLIGYVAVWTVVSTVSDSTLRDWFIVLIWPLLVIAGAVSFALWLRREPPEPPEVGNDEAQRARYQELEALAAQKELDGLMGQVAGMIGSANARVKDMRAEHPFEITEARHGRMWRREMDTWNGQVIGLIRDDDAALDAFSRPIDDQALFGLDWRERLALIQEIKNNRFLEIATRKGWWL